MTSGNVSIMYGMTGPNLSIVTACATSTHSIGVAASGPVETDIVCKRAGCALHDLDNHKVTRADLEVIDPADQGPSPMRGGFGEEKLVIIGIPSQLKRLREFEWDEQRWRKQQDCD